MCLYEIFRECQVCHLITTYPRESIIYTILLKSFVISTSDLMPDQREFQDKYMNSYFWRNFHIIFFIITKNKKPNTPIYVYQFYDG